MTLAEEPYRVVFTATAKRALTDGLPEDVATAAWELITGTLAANPHRVGKPLNEPFERLHAARRGTYRVTYRMNHTTRTITVIAIKHRKDAYLA
ncbi:type II toxin-antitoxin system RelE family toxin [Microtetraspora malaysiensis]|uniref:type II toxin-antitoxin system RelE family toxin n=1 Tax=Microtetraspora malaysiensis TaxID=161358 RepID=UPI003D927239